MSNLIVATKELPSDFISGKVIYVPYDEEISFDECLEKSRGISMNVGHSMRTLVGGKNPRMYEVLEMLYTRSKDDGVVRFIPAWEIYKEMNVTSIPKFPTSSKRMYPHMRTFLEMVELKIDTEAGVGYNKYYLRITPRGISFIEKSYIYLDPQNILERIQNQLRPSNPFDYRRLRMLYFLNLLIDKLPIADGNDILSSYPFTENIALFLSYEVKMPSYDTIKKMKKELMGWGVLTKTVNTTGYDIAGRPQNKGYVTMINPKISLEDLHDVLKNLMRQY